MKRSHHRGRATRGHKLPTERRFPFFKAHLISDFLGELRRAFTPMEDQWTFFTRDGVFFEEVDVQKVEGSDVIFEHRRGHTRLAIMELTDESRAVLEEGLTAPSPATKEDEDLRIAA